MEEQNELDWCQNAVQSDPDTSGSLGWKMPSAILASLFLNFFFWFEPAGQFVFEGSEIVYCVSLLAFPTLLAVLVFLGPALAVHRTHQSIFEVAGLSLGTLPAALFRVFVLFIGLLSIVGMTGSLATGILGFAFNPSPLAHAAAVSVLFLYLLFSGSRSAESSAKLAFFTNKLGVAMLIAAVIRVRRYFPEALGDLHSSPSIDRSAWFRLAGLVMTVVPMALVAADFGRLARTRRDVLRVGLFGLLVPMVLTLFMVSLIQRAAYHWRMDLGGAANIALALWGGDSIRFVPQWMLIAVITTFGLARFGAQVCFEAISGIASNKWIRWTVPAVVLVAGAAGLAWRTLSLGNTMELSAGLAASIAAVISVDFLLVTGRPASTRPIDWVGVMCLSGGWLAGVYSRSWSNLWEPQIALSVLIPYAVSFVLLLIGRLAQRFFSL